VSVNSSNGNVNVAQIAVTTINTNSFSSEAAYNVIGGIGVSNFSFVQGFYSANGAAGETSSASVSFSLTAPALVVVIGIGGGQIDESLTGLSDPTIDVAPANTVGVGPPLEIEHQDLGAGNYTVTENTDNSYLNQNAQATGDILGVLIFSNTANNSSSSNSTIPLSFLFLDSYLRNAHGHIEERALNSR
jgi:hypothetical protein